MPDFGFQRTYITHAYTSVINPAFLNLWLWSKLSLWSNYVHTHFVIQTHSVLHRYTWVPMATRKWSGRGKVDYWHKNLSIMTSLILFFSLSQTQQQQQKIHQKKIKERKTKKTGTQLWQINEWPLCTCFTQMLSIFVFIPFRKFSCITINNTYKAVIYQVMK